MFKFKIGMEVDERLRWLEARIASSLRPRGDELRSLFSDEENRHAFLAFCNHSESRRLFIHLPEAGEATIRVSSQPPRELSEKALFFLKCGHASKLSRESIARDVVYSECSRLPLEHLELVMREVYLPQMVQQLHGVSGDKLLDLLHRLVGSLQVTRGFSEGKVVLPLPSIEVLAEAASSADRHSAVIHALESYVVAWMKQVKIVLHFDPKTAILKAHGKYAGPLAEVEFWSTRLSRLESVRSQLGSVVVLSILHNLQQAHSTYAQAFLHVHRDISCAIADTEHCLMYLTALQPWLQRLSLAYSPETLVKIFPPLMATLMLVWQHSGVYSAPTHVHRLLRLLANEVAKKARGIVGESPLQAPEESLLNLKLALRVCAAFRGCYLDYRERGEGLLRAQQERREGLAQQREEPDSAQPSQASHQHPASTWRTTGGPAPSHAPQEQCPWPPRNSPVFASLNGMMEHCNDLLELVQTVMDFRELEYGVGVADAAADVGGAAPTDPMVADICSEFAVCLQTFEDSSKDLLSLEPDCLFEEGFFQLRSTVRSLEQRLGMALLRTFDLCPSLAAELRLLECFQGVFRREAVKACLQEHYRGVVSKALAEVQTVSHTLSDNITHPPSHPNVPPMASKLLWLHALRERVSVPMEQLREVAPQLLEGDLGWRLRQEHTELSRNIQSHISETEEVWSQSIPPGLAQRLKDCVLTRTAEGQLVVNLDPTLREVLQEIRYMTRPPLGVALPPAAQQLLKGVEGVELGGRSTSLGVVVQVYNELWAGLSEVDQLLFQHKLQQMDNLLAQGLERLDWLSVDFPDFVAKARALVCGDLQTALRGLHQHTDTIRAIASSWALLPGLDIFEGEGGATLEELQGRHSVLLESLERTLPPAVERISSHLQAVFQSVDASQESPAWGAYLALVDDLVLAGLRTMVLTAISTLVARAHRYEQGDQIPALVTVQLELQGGEVQFSPPLSTHSALPSIPEVVQHWMDNYTRVARLARRFSPGESECCYPILREDPQIRSAITKVSAHLETNARQCQSVRKRFSIYSFLWEQDVGATFESFMLGQATPHPRRFTRPETVRSRASARALSARSSSQSQQQLTAPAPEATLLGVMGVSDWDFLRPPGSAPSQEEEDTSRRPSLDDFDGEIAVFQGVLERLGNVEGVAGVGWLRVDQRPVRQALSSLAAKWKHTFTSYLERQIQHVLGCLEQFFRETEPEVEGISGEESGTQAFMHLMAMFNKVNTQQVEMDTKFGALHRAVLMLDKFGHPLSPTAKEQFSTAPQRWSNLKKRVSLGKQRIGPRIQASGELISQDLLQFGWTFTTLHQEFQASRCLHHECPQGDALEAVGVFRKRLGVLQMQARDLIELQELLETSIFNFAALNKFEEELTALQEVWTIAESVLCEHAQWQALCWHDVKTANLMVAMDRQLEPVSALPPLCHDWDVFLHLCNTIQEVQTTLPLVEGLRGPAMRPRHWKQVLHYATGNHTLLLGRGGAFDPAHLQEMTFGELLELGLHAHYLEVLAVVEHAERDVAIEGLLKTLEEVWLSRQLELRPYQRAAGLSRQETISEFGLQDHSTTTARHRSPSARVTSALRRGQSTGRASVLSAATTLTGEASVIMVLYNTRGIFETLESHQMSLQSQFGTAAATAFSDDLTRWHKQLQTVEAVLGAWREVQQLWVGLEEVYGSPEVQAHLSGPAFTFSSVDRELRELSMSTTRNPAVMPTCLKEGLLLSLEKMQTALLQCQAALLQYMEGKRQRWPWFYLLPTEDILLFVCYGSNPCHISSNISKLLPYASSLIIDHTLHAGGGSGRIMGVVSTHGEQLELNQPVYCEGSVESILQHLLTSLSATLQNQVVTVVTRHILKNGVPSLSDLPAIWSSSVATQVAVLATQLALELSTDRALQESGRGVSNALGELSKEVTGLMATAAELLQGTTSDRIADAARTVSALTVVHSESQLVLDSSEAPRDSPTDVQAEGSSSVGSGRLGEDVRVGGAWRTTVSRDLANKLQVVLMVLSAFRLKAGVLTNQLASSDADPTHSFTWESMLHFLWSPREQRCLLSSLHASLPYGHHYSGSSTRLVATPTTERCLVHLLQALGKGTGSLLTGPECSGKSSLVQELAVSAGQPLFSLHCSPHTHHTTLTNCIRGMVATGCWLFLHHVAQLRPAVLQSACSLLLTVQQARTAGAQTVDWPSGAVRVNLDKPGACFASVVLPRSCEQAPPATLPHPLLEAFRPCHTPRPQLRPILEALFLAHDFEGGARLARLLASFCTTAEEVLNQNPISAVQGDEGIMAGSSPTLPLGLPLLKAVISQAQRHLREFDALGLLQGGGALQMASGVHSEFSGSTRANLKFSSMVLQGTESERPTQRQSLEEFAVVLALKDWLLPSLSPTSPEHTTAIQLIGDLFPGCDLTGLLSHEEEVREGLAGQALEDRAAVESARESRAASAMQMVADEQQPSEVGRALENHIIHCCLLHQLSPTPSFQMATAHLHALLQPHPLVAVAGPSGSGKTTCIKVTAEVLRELGEVVNCITLASGAMREEQLFGFLSTEEGLWQEGLLAKLLARLSSTGTATPTSRWLIIDGRLSPTQLDTLVSCLTPDSSIKLSNGKTIQLKQSYRFLLEMPDLSALTPSTANKIGKLCMSPGGITWKEVVRRWLGGQREREPELWLLCEKYVAKCLDFLAPVVAKPSGPTSGGAGPAGLEPQSLQLSEVHLASTLCNILQSQLAVTVGELDSAALERQFSYAAVWTFGGFLTAKNRTIFDSWWRAAFVQSPELAVPGHGLLWDYYLDPQTHSFVHFSEAVPHYSPPCTPREAPFVPTVQSMAVSHLIRMLIDRDCPVLLNGSTGSGKTATLLQLLKSYCVQGVTEAGLLHVYTSRSTGAEGVWSQLQGALEWRWGRNHTPKGCRRLVCFIDDLHNAQPPSDPPSSSICELVRYHLAGGGVHDPASGKWYSISDVCYVCTSHASPSRELDPRFLKHFTTLHWEDYDSDTLFHIFSAILRSHFCPTNQSPSPVRSSQSDCSVDPQVLQALVQTAVQVHEKVRAMFLPTPERLHYLFSLRHISAIFRRLCLGLGRGSSSHDLLLLWQQESWWEYAGALSSEVDRERYWEAVCHALRKFFRPEELPLLLSERSHHLPPEAVAALRAQLAHHVSEHNTANPTLHVPLYESTVEEAWYLSRTLTSPHDLGHTLLLGHTHPEPVVRLAALHAGFTVVQPSHLFSPGLLASEDLRGMAGGSYGVQQLTTDLTAVYSSAGVKGERLLLLLTQAELFHESFLDCLYHFVKDAAISHFFPPEEQSHITSAIRAELSQAGLPFSTETAWAFFIDRVHSNLRVVVAVPQVGVAAPSGCGGWAELLNALRVCYHLPWDRKQLMDVAKYHLAAHPSMLPSSRENMAHLLGSLLLRLRAGSLLHPTCSNHSYQHFVERFVHELARSQKASKEKHERLAAALECVRGAEGRGAWLEEKLGREKEVLLEKTEGCSKLLTQIGQDTAISKEHSKLVSRQRARISHLRRTIPDYEHALELAREEKTAVVEGLRHVVGQLELESMQELRALVHPPHTVEELLAAVIIIVKSPSADTSWTKGAKRLMANLDRFRELLLEHSGRERGSEVILEALDPLLANPDLSPEHLEQGPGGLASAQLCRWVNGIVRLHTTLQTRLRPLEERVEAMNNSLKECSEKLSMQEAKVEDLQQRLGGLCSALESASVERSRQQEAVNSMAKELRETQDFINALAGVHERWAKELPSSANASTHAVGELATAVALAMFLGPCPPHTQQHTLTQHLAPLLQERGVGLHWQTADDLIRVLCLPSQEVAAVDPTSADDITGQSSTHCTNEPLAPPTYAHLCSSLLPLLVPGEFLDQWLARGYSLPELLRVGGVVSAWNRWPLIYDPEGFAVSWLQRYRGEELRELDATTRSSEFFLTLEQALLQGGRVLVRGVASSLDPALQPLVELGHTWHSDTGAKVIRFCGRKLHVHPSFHLCLSTASPPHNLPPALLTNTAVVDFSASLPLACELLLDSAFQCLRGDTGWGEAASCATECRQKLAAVEGELLASLGEQSGRQDGYWWGTDRVGRLMATSRELETELRGHMDKLQQLSATKSLLQPLAQHGALLWRLLRRLGDSAVSWEGFASVFHSAVERTHHQNPELWSTITATEAGGRGRCSALRELQKATDQATLQDAAYYLPHDRWLRLATALTLLAHGDPWTDPALSQEQLLFLSQGEGYLQQVDVSDDPPSPPPNVSEELWLRLHKLPLSTHYLTRVVESIRTAPQFWAELEPGSEGEVGIAAFPWREDGNPVTLEDLVLLSSLHQEAALKALQEEAEGLMGATPLPLLADTVQGCKGKPLLILYDEGDVTSSVSLCHLEAEIRRALQGKSVRVMCLGAGVEVKVGEVLVQPACDCLLVTDIQRAGQWEGPEWLRLLLWRTRKALATGCQVVLTASAHAPLPPDLLHASRVLLLSSTATPLTSTLPSAVRRGEGRGFLHTLCLVLSSIPEEVLSQCGSLPEQLRTVSFNLAVLHTTVALSGSEGGRPAWCGVPPYDSLLAAISHALSLAKTSPEPASAPHILSSLRLYVRELYSLWMSEAALEELSSACLSQEGVAPGGTLKLGSGVTQVVVPAAVVEPRRYADHVAGLVQAEQCSPAASPAHLAESVEELLAVLATLIGSNHTPSSSDHTPPDAAKVRERLEWVLEQLPPPLPLLSGASPGAPPRGGAWTSLPSTQHYQTFLFSKAISQFNSTLAAIRREADDLLRSAAVCFDSLPFPLAPVLSSVSRGELPCHWAPVPTGTRPRTLQEGVEELCQLHSSLQRLSNK